MRNSKGRYLLFFLVFPLTLLIFDGCGGGGGGSTAKPKQAGMTSTATANPIDGKNYGTGGQEARLISAGNAIQDYKRYQGEIRDMNAFNQGTNGVTGCGSINPVTGAFVACSTLTPDNGSGGANGNGGSSGSGNASFGGTGGTNGSGNSGLGNSSLSGANGSGSGGLASGASIGDSSTKTKSPGSQDPSISMADSNGSSAGGGGRRSDGDSSGYSGGSGGAGGADGAVVNGEILSRTLAAKGETDSAADYFSLIPADADIFKVVTARYNKTTKRWVDAGYALPSGRR